jgi:hypothetical protein
MSNAATMAEEIDKKAKGLKAGTVEVWGVQPVRPDDWLFVIVGAKAEGERLDLLIDDKTQGDGPPAAPGLTLSIWDPTGLHAGKKKIEIASASKVSWGKSFSAVKKGDKLEVSAGPQKSQPRDMPPGPALVLR